MHKAYIYPTKDALDEPELVSETNILLLIHLL